MLLKTLSLLSAAGESDEDFRNRCEDHAIARRAVPTDPRELEANARTAYKACCARMAVSRVYRPHGETSPDLVFEVPFEQTEANDVVARVIEMFVAIGFKAIHRHNDGLNDYDFLRLTAPANWVELLLRAAGAAA